MFLRSLSLKGFKSFADATVLDMEPGVTVVVGPNGSGKSNVVDAIGWVLGAQSPKAVRSQKMDDVIFAGTDRRAALGRAEVSLTIDNTSGVLPIAFSEVTVTRTLFRTGESEYALNGVPCRLLDVQELLSDSGVGRQQHVIISQGQIDAVLNARPEDRRLIIEEAAGVLKYRRRKERSQRRLAATEVNLTRLQDLLREVRRQLRPLERQADDARRHGAVVAELTALRIHHAGVELRRLRHRLGTGAEERGRLVDHDRGLRAELAGLDTEVMAAEARLSALGGDDLGDALGRFSALRERLRGLGAVLAERQRGIVRDRAASVDRTVVASLEADAARLSVELAAVGAEAEALEPIGVEVIEAEAGLAEARRRFAAEWADVVVGVDGRAGEVRTELAAVATSVERDEAEAGRVGARVEALDGRLARLAGEAARLDDERRALDTSLPPLADELADVGHRRVTAEAALAGAEAARRDADAEVHRWTARAEALAQALDQARSRAGAERLADVDGVIGTLLDLVEVDPGWERAFEAAAGEAVAAVVVRDVEVSRLALDALHGAEVAGAVLALGIPRPSADPGDAVGRAGSAPVGESVRSHVRPHRHVLAGADVEALLDALVGAAVAVDAWPTAVDAVLAHPMLVVVTPDGDRFGPNGWRVGVAGSGATGAALDEATASAERAAEAAARADAALAAARAVAGEVAAAEQELARRLDRDTAGRATAEQARRRLDADRVDVGAESDGLRAEHLALLQRLDHGRARRDELAAMVPGLEADEARAVEIDRTRAEAEHHLDERAAAAVAGRRQWEADHASIDQRRQFLARRLDEVEQRLARDAAERRTAAATRVELDRRAVATGRLAALVAQRVTVVEQHLADLVERRRVQVEAIRSVGAHLDAVRSRRSAAERPLTEVRERLQRAEIDDAEARLRLEAAVESLRRELDCEPEQALAAVPPGLPDGVTAAVRLRELERDLRLMGPINPLALEEFELLGQRHDFLSAQLEDVKASRRELAKVIRAVDAEIVDVFAAAFADVQANFADLFETLFPGGRGQLRLTDAQDLLETGIEIDAKPSGKNVKKLSLLSGGERSLTALAFLFAVFRARPSPFYVMDEVEAALDDVNLHRFLGLVHEFRDEAQLIIVSHQKRTMEAADCLYGVTMQPGGSSKVVSERVAGPEARTA